jgi:hypothetical protein
MNDQTSPVGPVSTDPTIAAVSIATAAGRQRRPDRIDLDDGDYLIPDQAFRAQFMDGAIFRTGKRADDDGLPFTLINGLKYRPVRRGQEWLRSRIKTLGHPLYRPQPTHRHRRGKSTG